MKLGHFRGQVHRRENLLGDLLRLDEGDQAQRPLALRAEELEPESFSQQLCPRDVPRFAGWLVLLGGCRRGLRGGRNDLAARGSVRRQYAKISDFTIAGGGHEGDDASALKEAKAAHNGGLSVSGSEKVLGRVSETSAGLGNRSAFGAARARRVEPGVGWANRWS